MLNTKTIQNKKMDTPSILKSIRKKICTYKHMQQNKNFDFKNKYKLYKN